MSPKLSIALVAIATIAAAAPDVASSLADVGVDATARVVVADNTFRPRATTIRRDGTVTWAWRGRRRHNVVFTRGSREEPRDCRARRRGDCVRRFPRLGDFEFVCTFHGSMAGVVRVRRR
jgi:plastocyanin